MTLRRVRWQWLAISASRPAAACSSPISRQPPEPHRTNRSQESVATKFPRTWRTPSTTRGQARRLNLSSFQRPIFFRLNSADNAEQIGRSRHTHLNVTGEHTDSQDCKENAGHEVKSCARRQHFFQANEHS